jgi:hypothetical protein
VPTRYRSQQEKMRIETVLAGSDGIENVYASPLAGRVLILFHFMLPVERMLIMLGMPAEQKQAQPSPSRPAADRY